MAKITEILCDVKPCMLIAERQFDVNGQTFYVCGEECFVKFWSREYGNWNATPYDMEITFAQKGKREESQKMNPLDVVRSDLQILKPN